MSITPDDLRQIRFAQQRKGGYDTEAVDRALDTVAAGIEGMHQEREQLIERLRALEAEVERYKAHEEERGENPAAADPARTEAPSPGAQDTTMVELLGETRAIRSMLQAVLAKSGALPGRPDAPPQ